jgi:sphinganine-1-phosphate aldolase
MKAYRDYARTTRGVVDPELVVPATAHAAFDKACDYFRIKLVKVPVDPVSFRADLAATAAAVTRNTIALVGSAPCFPQGVIDPIPALAALAVSRGLPLHVDCCLGSYLVALAEEATGTKLPFAFDFGVPGVTSISADTHKYGFAPKGSSVVMYSAPAYRHAQYFVAPEWTGGIYASPTIAGSRPGALVAGCWATLVHVGRDGYLDAARAILGAARAISDGVAAIPQLELYGSTDLSVVCFGPRRSGGGGGKPLNIYNVSDALVARGWNLNVLQNPACVHLCVTFANAGSAGRFLADLRAAVDAVLTAPPGAFKDGTGAIYGMAEAIPDKSLVGQIAYSFLDALYKA